ncbi:MAG: hypothetical protein LBI38_04370 [Oscillospiraceae bacterium]|nr:hypothetical protein [Oscillospiraceae bacterium]
MPRSNKTSQVMRLIASDDPALFKEEGRSETPPDAPQNGGAKDRPSAKPVKKSRRRAIIKNMEFKSEGGIPPGLKLPQKGGRLVYVKPAGERQVVNVVSLLVNEQLGAALERFNVCACGVCCLEITQRTMSELPPVFVHVSSVIDADEVNEKIARFRPDVIKAITKIVLSARNSPFHKNKKNEDET